jgi:glycosyltransferase involved in cell wall biosynthesis
MRLVFVTQQVDPQHPVLGAAVAKIRALAARVDTLDVLALRAVDGALPGNCNVSTFGARTQALRGVRYLTALAPVLAKRPNALLAHMSPIYALLAAPLARPLGTRLLLWYAQQTTNTLLERTERVVDSIFTVSAQSFPFSSPKVRAIGHGVDVAAYACTAPPGGLRLLGLGRCSPVKRWEIALRALVEVEDAELVLYGPEARAGDAEHRRELERLADELRVGDRVRFGGGLPHGHVPQALAACDALVNATRGGAADKAVFEAAAACRPAFASSPALAEFLPPELRFDDVHSLAERLRAFCSADPVALGRELRERVVAGHSVDHWADSVLEAVSS